MTIPTRSISIRPHHTRDAKPLFNAICASQPGLATTLPRYRQDFSLKDTRTWLKHCAQQWREQRQFYFVIEDKLSNTLLGEVSLNQYESENHYAHLGYWVSQPYHNQGIATHACRLAVKFARQEIQIKQLQIVTSQYNLPSMRIAEKLGAIEIGILPQRFCIAEQSCDGVLYSLSLSEAPGPTPG